MEDLEDAELGGVWWGGDLEEPRRRQNTQCPISHPCLPDPEVYSGAQTGF